jgi:hypothetical protein
MQQIKQLGKRVWRWLRDHKYVILSLLLLASVSVALYAATTARHAATDTQGQVKKLAEAQHQLRIAKANIDQLRTEQADSCKNYRVLRDAVNLFHGTMDKLLKTAQRAREADYKRNHSATDKVAVETYRNLRKGITLVKRDCAQRDGN